MFGHLMHSEKQFYDHSETFCKAIKVSPLEIMQPD